MRRYQQRRHSPDPVSAAGASPFADPGLVAHTERLLAGAVGSASARILVASVAKEEPIRVDEVIKILKNSQELMTVNRELTRKSAELQQLTRQLSEANERLKLADQHKDDFLSTVTHEIRTPITSIRALTEILHDNHVDEATRQHFLSTVIKEAERLTRLINQVLDLERIESGRHRLTLEALSMDEIIRESVEATRPLATDKQLTLIVQNQGGTERVLADRDRLMQVIINLISNAVKFSDERGAPIIIHLFCENQTCVVSVTDQGAGIDPAYHELIFEKFYQAHTDGLIKPTGSGLGLAISRRIIELHNGKLFVQSHPGRGAAFTFSLPLLADNYTH